MAGVYEGQDHSLPFGLVLLPGERARYLFTESDRRLGNALVTAAIGGAPVPDGAIERLTALCEGPKGNFQAQWFLDKAKAEAGQRALEEAEARTRLENDPVAP